MRPSERTSRRAASRLRGSRTAHTARKMTAAESRRTQVIHDTETPKPLVMSWAHVPEKPQQMPPSAANAMPRATRPPVRASAEALSRESVPTAVEAMPSPLRATERPSGRVPFLRALQGHLRIVARRTASVKGRGATFAKFCASAQKATSNGDRKDAGQMPGRARHAPPRRGAPCGPQAPRVCGIARSRQRPQKAQAARSALPTRRQGPLPTPRQPTRAADARRPHGASHGQARL